MNYNRYDKGGSTIVVKTVCAAVFLAFAFLWLYFFQADVLAVAQHVLSGGQTSYNRLIGALLITGVLQLLQLLVYSLTRLKKLFHALTYFPSMLLLGIVSSPSTINSSSSTLWWIVGGIFVIILWLTLVRVGRMVQVYERSSGGLFSRRMWVNLLLMALMIIGVASMGNTNAVYHFRAHAETSLMAGDVDGALSVGSSSHETDATLTMLRIYALSKKQQLGERLFHYPVCGGSDAMLPFSDKVKTSIFPADSIFRYLGAIPREPMPTRRYLQRLEQEHKAKPPVADYMLCACLLDRDLDAFANLISRYYDVSAALPLHYRQALTLYKHLRANPVLTWHDNVMEEDYADLQRLEAEYTDAVERKLRVAEKYAESYWYYYEYEK